MKKILFIVALFSCINVHAENINNDTLEYQSTEYAISNSMSIFITGFGDFITRIQNEHNGNTFDIGQAELNIESQLVDQYYIALAVAYDENQFTIGTFTVEYDAWSDSNSSSDFFRIEDIIIGGGQYDIPFGIDHHVYSSIDRKLISSPIIIINTHDSWNDLGAYLSVNATWGNASFYVANGFSHEGLYPDGIDLTTHNDLALGSRFGITPSSSLEIGNSVAVVYGLDKSHDILLFGGDIQMNTGNFEFKGEYIAQQFSSNLNRSFTNDGFYFQGLYNLSDWYIVGRYGEFRPDQRSNNISRLSAGIGKSINNVIKLSTEFQENESEPDAAFFQIAFEF